MSEAEKRELQELIDLLCKGQASQYDRRCLLNYIDKLQKENEEYHRIKKELIRVNKKIYDVDTIDEMIETIEKLQEELEEKTTILMAGADKVKQLEKDNKELEKTIDLIIDDFQAENYFVGMTNKEVREYYKKRKELKE